MGLASRGGGAEGASYAIKKDSNRHHGVNGGLGYGAPVVALLRLGRKDFVPSVAQICRCRRRRRSARRRELWHDGDQPLLARPLRTFERSVFWTLAIRLILVPLNSGYFFSLANEEVKSLPRVH